MVKYSIVYPVNIHIYISLLTVKELAELAYINKATFYSHYKDIYDLSEQLENEVVASIIDNLPSPEALIETVGDINECVVDNFLRT